MIKDWQASFSALQSTNKPVICAIHGHCLGSGVDLITAADIRMASRNARFSVLETKMAIVADVGTLQRLTRIVGRGHARELCFTSSYIPAERAEKIGLVNHVFEDKDELLMASRKMAELITQYPPSTVQGTKKILKYSEDHSEAEGLDYVMLWNTSFLNLSDLKKAASSFLKKEPNSNSKL